MKKKITKPAAALPAGPRHPRVPKPEQAPKPQSPRVRKEAGELKVVPMDQVKVPATATTQTEAGDAK